MRKFLFSLLFVFLILISTVSASDINSTDVIGDVDSDMEVSLPYDYADTNIALNSNDDSQSASNNSEQQVSESNQDSYSSSDDLIINPDFSDDIGNGWTIAGSVSKYENGRDGSCIKFDKGDKMSDSDSSKSDLDKDDEDLVVKFGSSKSKSDK